MDTDHPLITALEEFDEVWNPFFSEEALTYGLTCVGRGQVQDTSLTV